MFKTSGFLLHFDVKIRQYKSIFSLLLENVNLGKFYATNDLSFASTETKFKNPK